VAPCAEVNESATASSGAAITCSQTTRPAGLGMRPGLRSLSGQAGCSGERGQPAENMATKTKIGARVIFALIAQSKLVAATPKLNLPTNDRSISTASREVSALFSVAWGFEGCIC
jgi:hypothetical protein